MQVAHVEVDFLARDPKGILHIIEVKSAGSASRDVVSFSQQERLRRAALVLAARGPIEILILVVSGKRILQIPLE